MDGHIFENKIMTMAKEHLLFRILVLIVGVIFVTLFLFADIICTFVETLPKVSTGTFTVVEGHSMSPTILNGETVKITDNFTVEYGAIVIIEDMSSGSPQYVVKTVVAMGGDSVERRNNSYILLYKMTRAPSVLWGVIDIVNYRPEAYRTIITDFSGTFQYPNNKTPKLAEDQLFVMGDNYNHSTDSTESSFGLIKRSQVKYRVLEKQSILYSKLH